MDTLGCLTSIVVQHQVVAGPFNNPVMSVIIGRRAVLAGFADKSVFGGGQPEERGLDLPGGRPEGGIVLVQNQA
jgi:hypothetical protein